MNNQAILLAENIKAYKREQLEAIEAREEQELATAQAVEFYQSIKNDYDNC